MTAEFTGSLLEGIEVPAAEGEALIREVFHNSLFEDGITVRHRPRTANSHAVDGVVNHVVTSYVEHAFLTWLLAEVFHTRQPAMPENVAHCQSSEVDGNLFFPQDVDIEGFLEADFGAEVESVVAAEHRQAYLAHLAAEEIRKQKAKRVCNGCPLSLECLTRSIVNKDAFGVWGGLDERERHLMINRFETMRRSYENQSMPKAMRRDFEDRARQIATSIGRSAKAERAAA